MRGRGQARTCARVCSAVALLVTACSHDAGPPVATQLVFSTEPTTVTAGARMPAIQVEVRDASGSPVPSGTYPVTVSLGRNPGGATLAGTTTHATVNGVATFSTLTILTADSGYTLKAVTPALEGAVSAPFTVTPGVAAQLAYAVEPSGAVRGRPITPPVQVAIQDSLGNTVTTAANAVSLALGSNPGNGTLSGTTTVAATHGVATFATLVIDKAGSGYTLVATSGGLAGAPSATFSVVDTGTGISYHGGPIIYAPQVAALYWSTGRIYANGPTPGTFGTPATADQSLVGFFLRHLGGSAYFNINTTYYDTAKTPIQNAVTYAQYWADSSNPRDTTDRALQAEIEAGFASGKLVYDSTTLYVVFTGSGANPGGGFGTQYCAYHGYFIDASRRNVKYAAMPYVADDLRHCAGLVGSPNNDVPADAVVNVLAHELEETATDENLDAWYNDLNRFENGDLCAWQFGPTYVTGNGSEANQSLGGRDFLIQMNWVNATKSTDGTPVGCAQHWP